MERLNTCENCRNIGRRGTLDNYVLTGRIYTYNDNGLYIKRCCLIACYVGSIQLNKNTAVINHRFDERMRKHNPRYVITDTDAFTVYPFPTNPIERIRDLLPHVDNGKLVTVQRTIGTHPYTATSYSFTNKQGFEQKKIELDTPVHPARMDSLNARSYVYLIRTSGDAARNLPIYKVGRTNQTNFDRFRGYEPGYEIYLLLACSDCIVAEKKILTCFRRKYTKAYKNEYFEGYPESMIQDIVGIVRSC